MCDIPTAGTLAVRAVAVWASVRREVRREQAARVAVS